MQLCREPAHRSTLPQGMRCRADHVPPPHTPYQRQRRRQEAAALCAAQPRPQDTESVQRMKFTDEEEARAKAIVKEGAAKARDIHKMFDQGTRGMMVFMVAPGTLSKI